MSAKLIEGPILLQGIPPIIPLEGFPEGRVRIRMRNRELVTVHVKTTDGIRKFLVAERNGKWVPGYEIGANITPEEA